MAWDDDLEGVARDIAATNESPLRVMAGPGTGKSYAMKRRVARLLEEGTPPERILVVTFTRNAASALIEDLHSLNVDGCDEIHCGTLHSFCFKLLLQENLLEIVNRVLRPLIAPLNRGVLQFEGKPLLKDLVNRGEFGTARDCTARIRAFEAAWARLQSEEPGWPEDPTDIQFHNELIDWLVFHEAMLLGELIPEALRFLRDNPAAEIRTAYDEVIVDEYQDLNRAEQSLLDLLASNCRLSIVGDEDQSVYSFRFAHPAGITEFGEVHPGTHDATLVECRRCPLRVVSMADRLIRHNHADPQAVRLNPLDGRPPGEIAIVQWNTVDNEAEGIAQFVQHLLNERDFQPQDILVLSSRRLLGYGVRDALRALEIPTFSFFHEEALRSSEAQRSFCIFTLFANSNDRVALRWWLGSASATWLEGQYRRLREYCEGSGMTPWEVLEELRTNDLALPHTHRLVERFQELKALLEDLNQLDLTALVDFLFPDTEEWATTLREASHLALEDVDTVSELLDRVRGIVTQPEVPEDVDFVRVMSLHKSKGLSSRVVLVVGCIEGIIPFVKAEGTDVERTAVRQEQRRLFYVAVTRCTDILVLSSARQMERDLAHNLMARVLGAGQTVQTVASSFIGELGPEAPIPVEGEAWQTAGFAVQ